MHFNAFRNLSRTLVFSNKQKKLNKLFFAIPMTLGALIVSNEYFSAEESVEDIIAGQAIDGLVTYSREQIRQHNNVSNRIWVTYKDGVYDITDFIQSHPGGTAKIMLAAGASIDPFWALYGAHQKNEVYEILEGMRIGNYNRTSDEIKSVNDPYRNDPDRHPALIPRAGKPYNAETPRAMLLEFLTPNDFFYVRNHLPVPLVNTDEYKLSIDEEGTQKKILTLEDIKKFPKVTITATLQCSGQRRSELTAIKPIQGLNWEIGAVSNATWSGARLTDVLEACGLSNDEIKSVYEHVQFEGLDTDNEKRYGASIPIKKAFDVEGDVILAYEMNGAEMPVDHGFPLRVIVPGHTGARNVKWLSKINLSKEESHSFWQRRDYKGFGPNTDWNSANFDLQASIQEIPVNSAIVEPVPGELIEGDEIVVQGFAVSGGGRGIVRVDVSPDGGNTWQTAEVIPNGQSYNKVWAWSQWKCTIPVTSEMKGNEIQLCSKAVNSSYDVQPDKVDSLWNIRGVLNNAWHRINVKVAKE